MPLGIYPRPAPIERFLTKITICSSGCWLWEGALKDNGYAPFTYPGGQYAHRFSYEFFVGDISPDMELDHLCRVRHCANPHHLEVVSSQENTLRGDGAIKDGWCLNQIHYEDFYLRPDGDRQCRGCKRDAQRRWREKNPNYGREYMVDYNHQKSLEKELSKNLQGS